MTRARALASVIAATALGSPSAGAEPPRTPATLVGPDATPQVDPERHELAGFPIIGGNSDIGVQLGGAATLTRFHDGLTPYLWNLDLLLSASIKSDQNGTRLIQQSHVLRLDAPHLLGGRLRIDTRASFQRTINAEYFGLGNASSAAIPEGQPNAGRRYQYVQQEGRVRTIARVHTGTPFDLALGASLRYDAPDVYAGSKLTEDAAARSPDGSPVVRGTRAAGLVTGAAGFIVDTRDTEFITTRGIFYQVGVGFTGGSAESVAYGNTSAVLSHYAPIGGPFVFASRVVVSFEVGNVPFYDLAQGGTFEPQYLLGSESGVRGVPIGRYAGLVKAVTNVEIRTPFPRFRLFGQRFRLGTTTFFDAGRAWADYGVHPALDGTKLGLKFGVGGGVFLQWGDAAIFRLEAAYSPDAVSENPGFPVGIYVADGLMF
jgi:outer membrane protein assembly factor BamA